MEEPVGQISPLAALLASAFMIWMLVDAWRRRAPLHWFLIIVVMPFGAVFYFVVVKLRDLREAVGRTSLRPSIGPALGMAQTDVSPTADLDRADALEEAEQYSEAEALFRAALAAEEGNKRALHGLCRCLLGLGKAEEALAHFEKLMELDRAFANFGAALDYADALWAANQRQDAIELLERLADLTGRINHRLALGHYLSEFGHYDRATREIQRALDEGQAPGAPYNERQRMWLERGRQMLAELEERAQPSEPDDSN